MLNLPPWVNETVKTVAKTALHAAVFSYVTKKVNDYMDSKKVTSKPDSSGPRVED